MDIRQIKLSRMETFCYLAGDPGAGTCALIDPAFDTKRLLAAAGEAGYTITHIINTHGHADHCAGNAAIIKATGARLLIHHQDAARLSGVVNGLLCRALGGRRSPKPDIRLNHGDTIAIGNQSLRVLHTPGHSPGSICLYTRGNIITGDTLFVGGVGRTDLPGGSSATLLQSIRNHIYTLPGDTVVWPGHDYGPTPTSTVGQEMATNPFTTQKTSLNFS